MPCKSITNNSNLDLKPHQELFDDFFPYSQERLGYDKPFSLNLTSDEENYKNPLGKTAYYDPSSHEITIYTDGRHIKDIMRSLSHELVHHAQNCRGEFEQEFDTSVGYAQKDGHLRNMEKEAYLEGNLLFRDWEDQKKTGAKKMKSEQLKEMIRKEMRKILSEQEADPFDRAGPRFYRKERGWQDQGPQVPKIKFPAQTIKGRRKKVPFRSETLLMQAMYNLALDKLGYPLPELELDGQFGRKTKKVAKLIRSKLEPRETIMDGLVRLSMADDRGDLKDLANQMVALETGYDTQVALEKGIAAADLGTAKDLEAKLKAAFAKTKLATPVEPPADELSADGRREELDKKTITGALPDNTNMFPDETTTDPASIFSSPEDEDEEQTAPGKGYQIRREQTSKMPMYETRDKKMFEMLIKESIK